MSRWFWAAALLLCTAAWAVTGAAALPAATLVLLTAPLPAWLLLLPFRSRVRISLTAPGLCAKGERVRLALAAKYPKLLPFGGISARIRVENTLTGQTQHLTLRPGETAELESAFCGCLLCSVEQLRILELFGVLWVKGSLPRPCRTVVMAETFPVTTEALTAPAPTADVESYDPDRRGYDRSEPLRLRDYVPGDSPGLVHWKLSSKLGKYIVREPSLPVERSLLLYLHRDWGEAAPARADALLEVLISFCQALTEAGQPFALQWNEELMEVNDPEELPKAALALLCSRPGQTLPPVAANVLFFGMEPPAWEVSRAYVCGEVSRQEDAMVCFTPETAAELGR